MVATFTPSDLLKTATVSRKGVVSGLTGVGDSVPACMPILEKLKPFEYTSLMCPLRYKGQYLKIAVTECPLMDSCEKYGGVKDA